MRTLRNNIKVKPRIHSVIFFLFLASSSPVFASSFEIEKQKLKLSLESENFVDESGNEIRAPGGKVTYLAKMRADVKEKLFWVCDFQTGLKGNFDTSFQSGDLSPFAWSNRVNMQATVPVGRFYFGGGFYFRNKWLKDLPDETQFVDIFGGLGFREISGSIQAGASISPKWDLATSFQTSSVTFDDYPLSNSDWLGATVRLTRKFQDFRMYASFRARNIDYNRPVFPPGPIVFPVQSLIVTDLTRNFGLQRDRFREGGIGVEFSRPFYFSGGYAYQFNNSNNPGFSYHNHQINLLVGTELNHKWFAQAYGILYRYDFLDESGFLPFPLLLGENDDNNMAASLVRTMSPTSELEFGVQRLTHNSSFSQLNASKTIFYAAYNYRF